MLESIRSVCRTYYHEMPEQTLQSIGISAVYTFTYHLLTMPVVKGRGYEVNLLKPIMAATAASLASLIHALTTPIFTFIFGDNRVTFCRQGIKSISAVLLTDAIFGYSSTRRVNLAAFQVNRYLAVEVVKAAVSDVISVIDWINTHIIVSCFGQNRLQTSGITAMRERLTAMSILPNGTNSIFIAL
jgi:hypothetical protein